ncbi:MAG: GAF domain-containing protein, partial [Chloroflexota bacterium]
MITSAKSLWYNDRRYIYERYSTMMQPSSSIRSEDGPPPEQRARPFAPLLELIAAVSAKTLPLNETLAMLTAALAQLARVDGCTILRWDRELDKIVVLADYVSPQVDTPFANVSHVGAAYPLIDFPATAYVLQEHAPLVVDLADPQVDEAEKNLLEAFQWARALLIPMLYHDQAVGLLKLAVAQRQDGQFTGEDGGLYQALANQIALAIKNRHLGEEVEEGSLYAEALQVIGRALASELDHQRIVRDVADFAYRLVGAQFVCVAIPDEAENLQIVAAAGRSNKESSAIHSSDTVAWLFAQSPLLDAVQQKRPVIVNTIHDHPPLAVWQEESLNRGWRALAAVPLLAQNRLLGVLAASAYYSNYFGPNEVAILMSLASQAAVAVQNARLFAQLEANRQELQEVSLRLVNAQEEERRRISRELHDELGQALTALKINLDVARRAVPKNAPPKLVQSIYDAGLLAIQTLEAARNLSLELHPAILDDLGLISALRWEIDRYEKRTGQRVNFTAEVGEELALRPELQITIYRIITEALTNIARHAQASDVWVSL